jgi:hypothetical protein
MPKLKEKPPPPDPRPTCTGCDRCRQFDEDEDQLYVWTGKRYLCNECFFTADGRPWPEAFKPVLSRRKK